jgi:hypothetical protein
VDTIFLASMEWMLLSNNEKNKWMNKQEQGPAV